MFINIYKTTDHPDVVRTLENIAEQRSYLGDYQSALEKFEKVLGKKNMLFKTENYGLILLNFIVFQLKFFFLINIIYNIDLRYFSNCIVCLRYLNVIHLSQINSNLNVLISRHGSISGQ